MPARDTTHAAPALFAMMLHHSASTWPAYEQRPHLSHLRPPSTIRLAVPRPDASALS